MQSFFQRIGLRRSTERLLSTDGASVNEGASRLAGVIFVLLTTTNHTFGEDLAGCARLAKKQQARVFGMLAGLVQVVIEGDTDDFLRTTCKSLTEEIMSSIHRRCIIVWTVRLCVTGSWGDDQWMNYGTVVPDLQKILNTLGTAQVGDCILVS